MLARMNDVIRAGEEMRRLRAEMIKVFAGLGWTQEKIAALAGMSQPAVSKQMVKARTGDPSPVLDLSLGQGDVPWLEGRLWGLAEDISETLGGAAHCTRYVDALARGKKAFTPQNVDALRRLVEDDLRLRRGELPRGHRDAYDTVSRGLDVPAKAAVGATAGSAAVRRALARQVQLVSFREGV